MLSPTRPSWVRLITTKYVGVAASTFLLSYCVRFVSILNEAVRWSVGMSLLKTWTAYFQSQVRMRGRAYYDQGRVTLVSPEDGEQIRAKVRGTTTYTVTIEDDGSASSVSCTCPHFDQGVYCKHIWATLLEANRGVEDPSMEIESPDQPNPRPPKARKRVTNRSYTSRSEPEWSDRLSLLHVSSTDTSSGVIMPGLKQVCYVIRADLSSTQQSLIVEVQQRLPTATGWSKPKPLPIVAEQIEQLLPDPVDQRICAQLCGALWVGNQNANTSSYEHGRQRSTHVLPAALRFRILKQMLRTGRCCIRQDTYTSNSLTAPLKWDSNNPWVLWLVGTLDDGGLTIDVELRRNGQRMSARQPTLLIGGRNGVVFYDDKAAPFDDKGANQWILQFRDYSKAGGDQPASVCVPHGDIPKFLERLFRLRGLPELELPQELGYDIDDSVQLVPHLALHHVPDGEPPQIGGGGDRRSITARVWFTYDGQEVQPSQPGWFVVRTGTDALAMHPEQDENEGDEDGGKSGSRSDFQDANQTNALRGSDPQATEDRCVSVIRRDRQSETEAMALLAQLGLRHNPIDGDKHALTVPASRASECIRVLLARGWVVTADQSALRDPGPIHLSVTSGIDWFELRGNVQYETSDGFQEVGLPEILAAAKAGNAMIQLGDGSQGLLPQQWLNDNSLLAVIGKLEDDHLTFKSGQAALLDILLSQQPCVDIDAKFEATRQRLHQFEGIHPVAAGSRFQGQLRPYQEDGLGWFEFLRWLGIAGILADDMGLGKTVQVLAMLDAQHTTEEGDLSEETPKPEDRPSLVVVPRSLVFNWIDEAAHFAPQLRVLSYTGSDRHALREVFHEYDVIVTSYGLMRRDIAALREFEFDYVILDEAQAIKNPSSQSAKSARLLQASHRLALTGTPVENHLGDLWSIFEFLNPGMLGSHTKFAKMIRRVSKPRRQLADDPQWPTTPKESKSSHAPTANEESSLPPGLTTIAKVLRPFILRRTKKQVLKHLPEKTEQTIMCQMEAGQRKIYDQLLKHYRANLLGRSVGSSGQQIGGRQTMMVLEALLRLRQASCHPGLIDPKHADSPSAKTEVLLDRLEDLVEEGHKALVFSQFTSMLALVRKRLDDHGIVYEYLDGQTRDRKERVGRFQSDPDCPVFLISLKAGGLGLNLTAAGYVFILDPWWNPATEAQAIDRTHRIGQTRHVFAYRLICQDTIEQRISELQARKRELADAIISGQENPLRHLTRQDLEHLLS